MALMTSFFLKSILIAGATLGLLRLFRSRSAAERSVLADLGLAALVLVPAASLLLPPLQIIVPGLGAHLGSSANPAGDTLFASVLLWTPVWSLSVWSLVAYAVPALALLFLTLLALARLFALRTRAKPVTEPVWLRALAEARRRMGFRQGTALLTSNELSSPISWGLMRPVILLNKDVLAAHDKANAIIAHELAHVARLDWARLLIARGVTAAYWLNPLVWILAREAHQLREETADDAVLTANFTDTEYARLLVSIARHERHGRPLSAHGVAPGRNALARRVSRVLDANLARAPVARGFAIAIGLGATAFAAPLAALSFTSPSTVVDTAAVPRIAALTAQPSANAIRALPQPSRAAHKTMKSVRSGVTVAASTSVLVNRPGPKVQRFAESAVDPIGEAVTAKAVGAIAKQRPLLRAAAMSASDGLDQLRALVLVAAYGRGAGMAVCRIYDFDQIARIRAAGIALDFIGEMNRDGHRNLGVWWVVNPAVAVVEAPEPGVEPRAPVPVDSVPMPQQDLSSIIALNCSA